MDIEKDLGKLEGILIAIIILVVVYVLYRVFNGISKTIPSVTNVVKDISNVPNKIVISLAPENIGKSTSQSIDNFYQAPVSRILVSANEAGLAINQGLRNISVPDTSLAEYGGGGAPGYSSGGKGE